MKRINEYKKLFGVEKELELKTLKTPKKLKKGYTREEVNLTKNKLSKKNIK